MHLHRAFGDTEHAGDFAVAAAGRNQFGNVAFAPGEADIAEIGACSINCAVMPAAATGNDGNTMRQIFGRFAFHDHALGAGPDHGGDGMVVGTGGVHDYGYTAIAQAVEQLCRVWRGNVDIENDGVDTPGSNRALGLSTVMGGGSDNIAEIAQQRAQCRSDHRLPVCH